MVISFTSGAPAAQPGQVIEILTRFNKADWSYVPFQNFTSWDMVTAYINGTLVWR